jgi:hypothetical protein
VLDFSALVQRRVTCSFELGSNLSIPYNSGRFLGSRQPFVSQKLSFMELLKDKVKVKLSLCLITETLYREDMWGSRSLAPK